MSITELAATNQNLAEYLEEREKAIEYIRLKISQYQDNFKSSVTNMPPHIKAGIVMFLESVRVDLLHCK